MTRVKQSLFYTDSSRLELIKVPELVKFPNINSLKIQRHVGIGCTANFLHDVGEIDFESKAVEREFAEIHSIFGY